MSKKLIILLSVIMFIGSALYSQNQYVGAAKCKMCHNKETTGDQYKKWTESQHANAWKDLASAKALEVGKAKGVANPQTSPKCLKCHSTASGADKSLLASITVEEGVSCESCHGAGSAYKSMSVMKDLAQAKKNGLNIPDEKTCVKCHNSESPTFKSFNFAVSEKKIAHRIPK